MSYVCRMRLLTAIIIILLFGACENELDLVDDYKDIPVVYGLLSNPGTNQYIRVEKAFVDPVTSALILAQNPDSIYYKNATVSITNEKSGETIELEKVDGNLEGLQREMGVFASSPNYLYKFNSENFPLNDGDNYTLNIVTDQADEPITASTRMVGEPRITVPSITGALDFNYVQPSRLQWRGGDHAAVFDVTFLIKYKERNIVEGTNFENKTLRWNVVNNYNGENFEVDGINFYGTMAANLAVNNDLERRFLNIDMVLTSGGQEILDYVAVGQANTGFTSSQVVPTFSNLSTGRGLFSSSYEINKEATQITPRSLDSLINGIYTKQLNFIN